MFADRLEAGRRLAAALAAYRGRDVVVLGLPRGGVPVAAAVARALGAPLDVILVRKLGVPVQPELAMGAIGEDGVRVVDTEIVRAAGVTEAQLAAVEARERAELERRSLCYRGDRPRLDLTDRAAIVVDDGVATGSTARAACQVARAHGAARVVLAVPVAPPDWTERLATAADELVAVATPEPFHAIGQWYEDFSAVGDDEVVDCLTAAAVDTAVDTAVDDEVTIAADGGRLHLPGHLTVPAGATGIVLFAHGSGSSRFSARNIFVADALNDAGLGTLLFDLLTGDEADDRRLVFDVELLARRLGDATAWLRTRHPAARLGYFGASTGAGAALRAAADPGAPVGAVVSRGGRPDLAGRRLADVHAPTLLIVGGRDDAVLGLNREAAARLRCEHRLEIVPGATHLFEEPGALEQVTTLARGWFLAHLQAPNL